MNSSARETKPHLFVMNVERRKLLLFNYMLDPKWIKQNPEKFDKAMENRVCPIRSREIILLMEIAALDKQILELENSIKKLNARLFFMLKKVSDVLV